MFNVKHLVPYIGDNPSLDEDASISGLKFLAPGEDDGIESIVLLISL